MIQLLRCFWKVRALALAVLLALPGAARAGDVAALELIGFSADGRRFAILQSGVEDGSGRAYARLEVVAAGGRASLLREVVLEEGPGAGEARGTLLAELGGELARLGLEVAAEAGLEVAEIDQLPSTVRASIVPRREVAIEVQALPHADAVCAEAAAETQAVELVVRDRSRVFTRQAWVPAIGECVLAARIAAVRVLERDMHAGLGIVIAYSRLGFEGPDVRFVPLLLLVGAAPRG